MLTNSGDVGGQKTLRTYWKNYFEKTDTLIWVVDSTDAARLDDCRDELKKLLLEEVGLLICYGIILMHQLTSQAINGCQPASFQK